MLKNYLKTALRNILRQRTSTILNVAGLSLGITTSLVLFLLVSHLISYDNFHSKKDRIYRVTSSSVNQQGNRQYGSGVPAVLPEAFANEFSEVEDFVFTSYRVDNILSIPQANGEPKLFEENSGVVFTQPSFFRIFDRPVLQGDPEKGLDDLNEAMISKSWAIKFFGTEDVVGKVIEFGNAQYTITGVVSDYPTNTDFPFELFLSYSTVKKDRESQGWGSIYSDDQLYVTFPVGTDINSIEARIPDFVNKNLNDNWSQRTHHLQPLSTLHFDTRYSNYNYRTVGREVLISLGVVAFFLIVTACINFINLTTAEAIKRSKEVGIRKTLGSSRWQLIRQFLSETTLITLLAILLSVGLAQVLLNFLNDYMQLSLTLRLSEKPVILFLGLITIFVSLISGAYPSFVLSGFNPIAVLKNSTANRNSSGYFMRKGLVVVQFFISQFFIIATIVLITQTNYFNKKDLGFDREAIFSVHFPNDATLEKKRAFKTAVSGISGVERVSLAYTVPSSGSVSSTDFSIPGEEGNYETQLKLIDEDYLATFGLELLAGENVLNGDTVNRVVVNEAFIKSIGITNPQDALGKVIRIWDREVPIVGVVKDFHTVSLRRAIEPTALFNGSRFYRVAGVKLASQNLQESVKQVEQIWNRIFPGRTYQYEFLDEAIANFYESEARLSTLLIVFTGMAIFIGCLGLFGLATFMANQRNKEVGVRKVLGASVESIVFMFSKEYIKLVAIGFVLAAPLAWFVMNKWLESFAYRIEIGPAIFITGAGITILIALVTVGYRSVKAAIANPVKSLRYE